jgi:hypothetical protein
MKATSMKDKLANRPVEEILLTPEQQESSRLGARALVERAQLGGDPDPALQSSAEHLMSGGEDTLTHEEVFLAAEIGEGDTVVDTMVEERERFDFSFSVKRVAVQVEKAVVVGADGERRMVSASTASVGPPRSSVTWEFLAHMAVLVVQYAMPLHRLGRLLTTPYKKFTAGGLGRHLHYVAERLLPIYLELLDQLAESPILQGDDTSSRVLEVNRYLSKKDSTEEEAPWSHFANRELAQKALNDDRTLAADLAGELGFEFNRRDGTGTKASLNTTTVSGRSIAEDPRSLIVFYRTHLGGFGNLLEVLLEKRQKSNRDLTIQSDLSTVNLVGNADLGQRFNIRYVGCLSHARRPFAIHEAEDPDYCSWILHEFKGIAIHEHGLNIFGRNRENVLAVRDVDSRKTWNQIRDYAQQMTERWSPATKLGAGARYIIRHFDKLTAYLDDPRLEPTNNFSERMLRMEKLIQRNSLFRQTLEGRFVLDILRTALQTAVAAGISPEKYLLAVLRSSPAEIAANPDGFTPRAWAAKIDAESAAHEAA